MLPAKILSLILHKKKNLGFLGWNQGLCRPCILCIADCGTVGRGRGSSLRHLQMGTVDSMVWSHIRLVHVETCIFLTNLKSVHMKSAQNAIDRRMT